MNPPPINICGTVSRPVIALSEVKDASFPSTISSYSYPAALSSALALIQNGQLGLVKILTSCGALASGSKYHNIVSASDTSNGSPGKSGSINIFSMIPLFTSIE
jgi:hypothetical protein